MPTRYSEEPGVSGCTVGWRNSLEETAIYVEVDAKSTSASPADARLGGQIDQALRATGHLSLRRLEIIAAEGLVVLRGRLPSYYLKQVAQTAVRAVPGVGAVHDELDIVSPRSTRG
jgi:osmotically-inducible protein OsmY